MRTWVCIKVLVCRGVGVSTFQLSRIAFINRRAAIHFQSNFSFHFFHLWRSMAARIQERVLRTYFYKARKKLRLLLIIIIIINNNK